MNFLHLVILILATWRLSSLFANEDGPFDIFLRIRRWAEVACSTDGFLCRLKFFDGLCCEWCNSVWLGTVLTVAYYFLGETLIWLTLPLALSTGTVLVKYTREHLEGV